MNEAVPDFNKVDLYITLLGVCVLGPALYYIMGVSINFWIFMIMCTAFSLFIRWLRHRKVEHAEKVPAESKKVFAVVWVLLMALVGFTVWWFLEPANIEMHDEEARQQTTPN